MKIMNYFFLMCFRKICIELGQTRRARAIKDKNSMKHLEREVLLYNALSSLSLNPGIWYCNICTRISAGMMSDYLWGRNCSWDGMFCFRFEWAYSESWCKKVIVCGRTCDGRALFWIGWSESLNKLSKSIEKRKNASRNDWRRWCPNP